VVNSGTIDRHCNLWGAKKFRYLGDAFERPVIRDIDKGKLPANRREQAETPKVVIAGMTKHLEAVADIDGCVLAGKSTTIVMPHIGVRYLAGVLNADYSRG